MRYGSEAEWFKSLEEEDPGSTPLARYPKLLPEVSTYFNHFSRLWSVRSFDGHITLQDIALYMRMFFVKNRADFPEIILRAQNTRNIEKEKMEEEKRLAGEKVKRGKLEV